jgi:hypothetical protein
MFGKDVVPEYFIQFAHKIADADVDDVPKYKWGSAVLSETYHALCKYCTTVSGEDPNFPGYALLLQLWSYTRFTTVLHHMVLKCMVKN